MNTDTKQLLYDVAALKDAMHGICPHCQQTTLRFIEGTDACDCTNPECPAYAVTLTVEDFITLTPEKLAAFQTGKSDRDAMDKWHEVYEDHVEVIMRRAEAMRAARDEKRYG